MARKKVIWMILAMLCLTGIVVGVYMYQEKKEQPIDFMERLEKVLGDEWKKQKKTVVAATMTYADEKGNEVDYHFLKTTYYEADPSEITGLHTSALGALFRTENAINIQEMMIQDWPGALYELEEKSYLCWTYSPELTYVLEYNPNEIPDAVILKMAEGAELPEE